VGSFPEHRAQIQKIYRALNYDLIEAKILLTSSEQKMSEVVFPRKLGLFGDSWEDIVELARRSSPYGHFPSFSLVSIIVKSEDDVRQDLIIMQCIKKI